MTKNPFYNSIAAAGYVFLVSTIMFYAPKFIPSEDNVFMPLALISLFTLSAAVTSYLFLFQPLQMFLDGKKQKAVALFLQTVACFAVITFLIFLILFIV